MLNHRLLMSIAALLCSATFCIAAGEPATSPSQTSVEALSPAVGQAIAELSSDNFQTRQAAVKKLQLAMGRQMRALIASDDPETQARLTSLLQFNDGLARWMLDVMKLPPDQRKSQLDFGLREDVLPAIAGIFSAETDKRVQGVKALGKFDAPEATAMLARLIDDTDRHVYIAAMEAVWDRKPTQAVVDALWQRAIDAGFTGYRSQPAPIAANPMFRGRVVAGSTISNRIYIMPQDAAIAGEVLAHLHSPLVGDKLDAFMGTLETLTKNNPWLFNNNTEYVKNMFRLVTEYKTPGSMRALYRLATTAAYQPMAGQVGNEKYYWSARTSPLAALIEATGQKPEDYRLKRIVVLGNVWAFPAEKDENDAIKKLRDWMSANGQKLGLQDLAQPTTQPAIEETGSQKLEVNDK
ncbi:MAG: hypothetical protein FWD61_20105 [Phycisphaerales bacterium]|nr:hypothetical protein [Phycisphaerales bacterium]